MADTAQKIVPGAFYWSRKPGGWSDAATMIHVPGPVVKIDKASRQITAIDSLPNPIQLPTHKISYSLKNPNETEECAFDRYDAEALCEGFNLAVQTGNIELLDNATVQELFPNAWEKRQDKIVYSRLSSLSEKKPLGELVDDFLQQRKVRLQSGESLAAQDEAVRQRRIADHQRRLETDLKNGNASTLSQSALNDLSPDAPEDAPPTTESQPAIPPPPPGA